jgi:isoleucyl-tRNA synthetase
LPESEILAEQYSQIAQEELNVKEVSLLEDKTRPTTELDLKITPALKREGMMREVVRNVQNARKTAGLDVDDRIVLSLSTSDDELRKAITEHRETIVAETLAKSLEFDMTYNYETACAVDDAPLTVSLQKA